MAGGWRKVGVWLGGALALAAQCSDNGICGLEGPVGLRAPTLALTLLDARSGGSDQLHFRSVRVEGGIQLGTSGSLVVTLPFHQISGPLGAQTGVGDLIVRVEQSLWRGRGLTLTGQMGGRVGTGRADGDPGLPQAYQTGLGGMDGLLGLRLAGAALQGGFGYQWAGSRNDNPLTRLKRGDDLLAWVDYGGQAGALTFSIKANLIKRLGRSSVRDQTSGGFMDLPHSDFTQANLTGALAWPLTGRTRFEMGATLPLLSRKTNEDGSKRALTLQLGVRQQF